MVVSIDILAVCGIINNKLFQNVFYKNITFSYRTQEIYLHSVIFCTQLKTEQPPNTQAQTHTPADQRKKYKRTNSIGKTVSFIYWVIRRKCKIYKTNMFEIFIPLDN